MNRLILCLSAASFVLCVVLTALVKRLAPRWGFVDKPGGRKIHAQPKPLGGGIAIFWSLALPLVAALAAMPLIGDSLAAYGFGIHYIRGAVQQVPLAIGLLAATLLIHLLGLRDDRKAMGPFIKLIAQLAITAGLVIAMEVLSQSTPSLRLRALGHLGVVPSIILTVLWITAITNAFNFLDNMDGLSAGVAAVCAAAFLVTAMSIGQTFVAATLALLLGALLGFLCFNFSPASIFMGDSGSLTVGFVLGVLTIRTQYLPAGTTLGAGWYAVFAPVIVLAVPLYDLVVVSIIRLSRGKSPFVGDTNHFSHRLVARGMSRRTAVLCLYLITAATSVAAILLPHVTSARAAWLIFGQTILILAVVALLEQHPLHSPSPGAPGERRGEGG